MTLELSTGTERLSLQFNRLNSEYDARIGALVVEFDDILAALEACEQRKHLFNVVSNGYQTEIDQDIEEQFVCR